MALIGAQKWAVLLCTFRSSEEKVTQRHPRSSRTSSFVPLRTGDRYWRDVSFGAINLDGSRIFGWERVPDHLIGISGRRDRAQALVDAFLA